MPNPTLAQYAQPGAQGNSPALGDSGWKLMNVLSGGKGSNGFSLGSLRPEDFGMSQEQMLGVLRQYDPNAAFTEYNYGNEGGNSTTESALSFDVSKLPKDFARNPNAVNLNTAGVKLGGDGRPDTGDLYRKDMVKYDPVFGYYTPTQNSKYRTQNDPIGEAMAKFVMPMVLGWAAGPLAGGLVNAGLGAAQSAANGNWAGAGLSALGGGLSALGVPSWAVGGGKTLASWALANNRR